MKIDVDDDVNTVMMNAPRRRGPLFTSLIDDRSFAFWVHYLLYLKALYRQQAPNKTKQRQKEQEEQAGKRRKKKFIRKNFWRGHCYPSRA